MNRSHHLGLPYIMPAQAQKHVTHNEAIEYLDIITQACVLAQNITTPPQDPVDGARYIIGDNAAGLFEGQERKIASWLDGTWTFFTPNTGWRVWVEDTSVLLAFDGTQWADIGSGFGEGLQALPMLGINANADSVNKLTVKSPSVLLSHEDGGTDIRAVINKGSASAAGTLLFQDGYSGRAELGLSGNDDLTVKVSPNGALWHDAIIINNTSGSVSFPNTDLGVDSPIDITLGTAERLSPALKISGTSRDNSSDAAEGVGLYLTHNDTGNRQFTLMSTDSLVGVRIVVAGNTPTIDGYRNGARADLQIGSNTHGAHVGFNVPSTQLSVSNWSGDAAKTAFEVMGAAAQSGDYLSISSSPASRGDVFKIDSAGGAHLSAPLQLVSTAKASLPPAAPAGGIIFVSDAAGGACPAYCDGAAWRRMSDQSVID